MFGERAGPLWRLSVVLLISDAWYKKEAQKIFPRKQRVENVDKITFAHMTQAHENRRFFSLKAAKCQIARVCPNPVAV